MNGRFDKIAPGLAAKLNLLLDELLAVLSLLLVSTVHAQLHDQRLSVITITVVAGWFLAAGLLRLYSPCTPRTKADAVILNAIAVFGVALTVAITQALSARDANTPVEPVMFGFIFATASSFARIGFMLVEHRLDRPLDEVIIVGTGPHAVAAYERITAGEGERRSVVGLLRLRGQAHRVDAVAAPVLGDADDLLRVVSKRPVSEVYLAAPLLSYGQELQRVVRLCEDIGLPFALPLHALRLERAVLLSPTPAPDGFLHYQSTKFSPSRAAIKRLIDIIASAGALALLSPLLVGTALAIKLTSRGPVLFKQIRVGLHGATFNLFKFRSMVQNAEALRTQLEASNEQSGPVFKIRNDPRITAVGRFIRKFSIDELPQIINILRGDMTIVGPRPALPAEVARYRPWQRRRLSVRPGLTCFWQVGGRNAIAFEDWMRLDLQYVDNWSLGLDLRLILQTLPVVIAGKGAS
jgi:exopolysaccharide biosynthesis polyprenyl glycosylphosphotransferase